MIDSDEIVRRFTGHRADTEQQGGMLEVRAAAAGLAEVIVKEAPPCRETSLAITHLEEAVFWANAAIARPEASRG